MLRKIKLLNPTKEQVEVAMEQGRLMAKEETNKQSVSFMPKSKSDADMDLIIKKYARNFCVGQYFESNPLNEILENIDKSYFNQNEQPKK